MSARPDTLWRGKRISYKPWLLIASALAVALLVAVPLTRPAEFTVTAPRTSVVDTGFETKDQAVSAIRAARAELVVPLESTHGSGDFHGGTVRQGAVGQFAPPRGIADFHGGVVREGSEPETPVDRQPPKRT